MIMPRVELAVAAALFACVSLPAAAATREPPACSAMTFRPIASGLNDGVQNAGLYKSRFGRIEVKANVKGGAAQGYFVEIDGKPPTAVAAADLPKNVTECAKLKRMSAPDKPEDPCLGDRLAVLTSHSGDKRYTLLYGHEGHGAEAWHFCSAGAS
jgi:hypothetical protein